MFDALPASIHGNNERLKAASWVVHAYNGGRKGTLMLFPIGFGEVTNPDIKI